MWDRISGTSGLWEKECLDSLASLSWTLRSNWWSACYVFAIPVLGSICRRWSHQHCGNNNSNNKMSISEHLLNTNYRPGSVMGNVHGLSHLTISVMLRDKHCYYSHWSKWDLIKLLAQDYAASKWKRQELVWLIRLRSPCLLNNGGARPASSFPLACSQT